MDNELRFFLQRGPTSVKELARLTGKSTSTLYKALKDPAVQEQEGEKGKLFFIAQETNEDGAGAAKGGESTPGPSGGQNVAPASPAAAKAGRGRKATAAGQKLTATVEENPRRKNSHGYRSLQIVIDNPGLTTEEYTTKGGRLNDLRWDIAHGNVRAES